MKLTKCLVVQIIILLGSVYTHGDSFGDCFDQAVDKVAAALCPNDDLEARKECLTNVLANSILPCFKDAADLNLIHLLVPEIDENFLTTLRHFSESFHGFNGNEIIIHGVPSDLFSAKVAQLIDSKDLFYSGWILPSPSLTSFYEAQMLLDVTANLTDDSAFEWPDVGSFVRKYIGTIDNKVIGIPVSGDLVLLYYRKDVFESRNISHPETWEQVLSIAERLNGTDFNGDEIGDFGACLSNSTGNQAEFTPYFQSLGTEQGMMYDANSMNSLFKTDAMAWVFELFRGLADYGPYSQSHVNDSASEMFRSGRCLMILGSQEIFHKHGKEGMGDWLGIAELPGSWYVYDRNIGAISRCTTTLCPHGRLDSQGNIVNFAPFSGGQGLTGAVNTLAPRSSTEVMLNFLSYVGGPSLSFEIVASVESFQPFRWSHLRIDRWVNRGWEYSAALDYINTMSRSFVSGNVAIEPALPSSLNIDPLLEYYGDQIIQFPASSDTILNNLQKEVDSKLDNYGKQEALRIYRASLSLLPTEDVENEEIIEPSSSSNSSTLVLGLLLPLLFLFLAIVIYLYISNVRNSRIEERPVKAPTAGPQTTLVITDIQDSTTLWETLDADIMDEALQLHNECLRQVLRQNRGYESATEGDAFIIAFHTASDAIQFCHQAQLALLEVNWPQEILDSTVCPSLPIDGNENILRAVTEELAKKYGSYQSATTNTQDITQTVLNSQIMDMNTVFWGTGETDNARSSEGLVGLESEVNGLGSSEFQTKTLSYLFRGLRVRMGIYTGVESDSDVVMNNVSGRMMYTGSSMALAKAISDIGHGGQIIISESTYKAISVEKMLENLHILHLGEYSLSESLSKLQFYEVISKELVSRLLHFPPLRSAKALSPAWYQAPSGTVCLSFTFVVGAETLSQWNGALFREALAIYESIAREGLYHYGGYQVEAADGLLLVAFTDPAKAIAWALTLHEQLSNTEWYFHALIPHHFSLCFRPNKLLQHPLCETLSVHSVDRSGMVHLRKLNGLRLKTGIERGPAKATPHPTTGFMAYRGKVINRSARITKFANAGQVLSSMTVWTAAEMSPLMSELGVKWESLGTQRLKGVMETVDLCHLFTDSSMVLQQSSIDMFSISSSKLNSDGEF